MKLPFLRLFPTLGLAAVLAALAGGLPSAGRCADAPKVYPINLTRSTKVGDKFSVVSSVAQSAIIGIDAINAGKPPTSISQENQQRIIHLEADGEVLKVYPNGNVEEVALTVKILRVTTENAADFDPVKAGAKIVAERINDKTAFAVDGKPATTTISEILHEIDLTGNASESPQEIFGPSKSVAVGETWKPNALLAAHELLQRKDLGDSVTVQGVVKFETFDGEGENQIDVVSYHLDLTGMKAPLPKPFEPTSGIGKENVTLIFPVKRQGLATSNATIEADYVSETRSPDGRPVTATVKMVRQRKDAITWK